MLKIDEYVVYKHDVCKIVSINNRNNLDYYVLVPISDSTLKISVPCNNTSLVRKLISKEYAYNLIDMMPNIEVLNMNVKLLENEYKILLNDCSHESLIKIIKTTYLRNKERIDTKRKTSDKDEYYFNLAEKYLYNELAIVLEMTYDEVKEYIIERINKNL